MADFSKQWCDLHDPEMPYDFDIEEIADELDPGYMNNAICEGFGFIAIAKDDDNRILLAFPVEDSKDRRVSWIEYQNYIEDVKAKL